jgi:Fe-S-cluster containining protein
MTAASKPFYEDGLRFTCKRCSLCCTRDSGYVFLTEHDLELLVSELKMKREEFLQVYCRWVRLDRGTELLSLREKANNDCYFWKDGCTMYAARPLQCRSYPFWKNFLCGKDVWDAALAECPGANSGELHSKEYIENCIANEDAEPVISRPH